MDQCLSLTAERSGVTTALPPLAQVCVVWQYPQHYSMQTSSAHPQLHLMPYLKPLPLLTSSNETYGPVSPTAAAHSSSDGHLSLA